MKFKMYECECDKCKKMCHAPCCGTPSEIQAIMDAGYGDRLCLDDWPGQPTDIHPALKGFEGEKAPYQVSSYEGCTFWKDGKCELHDKGLKPLGGKAAYHDMTDKKWKAVCDFIKSSWESDEGKKVIENFKEKFLY